MDLHVVPGIEAKHAAEAHREDLRIQDEYGCRCITYWVDESQGNAFCLIDAPNKQAVIDMHNGSHGLIPHEIIQVNSNVVEAFLGRVKNPKQADSETDPALHVFNDPAFRILLVVQTRDEGLLRYEHGVIKAKELATRFHKTVRNCLQKFEGREIEGQIQGIAASFVSVSQAMACAHAIQQALSSSANQIPFRLGMDAGLPVDESGELFGSTVRLADNLSSLSKGNQLLISATIKELYREDASIVFEKKDIRRISRAEQSFIESAYGILENKWTDPTFNARTWAQGLSLSKSSLYRNFLKILDTTPNELLRNFRLARSLRLLQNGDNITEVSYGSGFNSPSYFSKCFQEAYHLKPMAYLKALR